MHSSSKIQGALTFKQVLNEVITFIYWIIVPLSIKLTNSAFYLQSVLMSFLRLSEYSSAVS